MSRRFALAVAILSAALAFSTHAQIPVYDWARATANKPQPSPLSEKLPVEIVFVSNSLSLDRSVSDTFAPALSVALFGIPGGMIADTAVKNGRERTLQRLGPIIDGMQTYDFNNRIETALRAKLRAEGISPDPTIMVYGMNSVRIPPATLDRILTIYPYYALNNDFTELRVKLFVQIIERRLRNNGTQFIDKARFNRIYSFSFQIEDEGRDDNMQYWASLGENGMRAMADHGIEQVTDMLVYDFSPQGRREWRMTTLKKSARLKGRLYRGLPVRTTEDWVWVRTGTKQQGFEGYHPIVVPTDTPAR